MANSVSSNYNGSYLDVIYSVFDTGNEVAEKALAAVETGIKHKKSLGIFSASDNPLGDYSADAPSTNTADFNYKERVLEPSPAMLLISSYPKIITRFGNRCNQMEISLMHRKTQR